MLKTLKRKIALVAVAAVGVGMLSAIPASAALSTTTEVNFVGPGSTTAVTAAAGAVNSGTVTEVISVRSTSASNTFLFNVPVIVTGNVLFLHMSSAAAGAIAATTADMIPITCGASGTNGACVQSALTTADAVVAATTKGIANTVTGTSITGATFTTGALTAGTYTIWASTDAALATPYKLATVTSYAVGAPVTVAFNKKYTTVGLRDGAYTTALKDSASRSTFLVGNEQIVYSLDAVAATVNTMDTPGATTSASAPQPTAGVFAVYTVTLDADNAGAATLDASVGVTYGLNAVIQVGVNSFGSTSTTYRFISTTNGLLGALSVTKAAVAVTTATLAQSDTIAVGDFLVKLVDSTGAVVEGVTPTLSVAAGTTATLTSDVTGATGTGNALAAQYTAPATGSSDTLTWTVTAGSAATITASLAITLTTSVALAGNSAILSVAGNGGFIAGTPAINNDLTGGGPNATAAPTADPANTTKLTTGITVTLTAAPLTPQSGAVLSVTLSGTTPTANMTASATSITTDAAGKASVDVTVAAARATETVIVTIKSGALTIGVATYTFTASAVTIAEISMGPAQAITAKAGTATPVKVTVVDQYGQVKANQRIQLSVAGPSAPTAAPILITGADGTATYSVTGTTAISGQTDIVTVTELNAGAVVATADDVVTITYTSSEIAASTITVEYALEQATPVFALQATTAIATAIAAVTNDGTAELNEDAAHLTPDTSGNWTDAAVAGLPNDMNLSEDEVVRLRFTVKNAAGTALSGVKVTITAPAGGFIASSATVKVATLDAFTNSSGQVAADVWSQKVGDAVFTAAVGTVTASQTIPYGTSNIAPTAARYVTVTPATASVTGGNAQLVTATVTDRFGNPVKGVTVTFSELGTGRLTGTNAVTTAAGTSEIDFTSLVGETGTSVVTATIAGGQQANLATFVGLVAGTATAAFTSDATAGNATATSALTVTAGTAAADTANAAIKTDVATANAAVKALATQVTVLQASVATLIDSLTTQIAALLQSVSALTKAVAKLQAKKK